MAVERSPFDVLGVRPTATEREIRRAYRRRVVTTHRTVVLGLVDRLRELTDAYEVLKSSAQTRGTPATSAEARPSGESRWKASDSVGVRSPIAREIQRQSLRVGAEAQRENAATMKAITDDYDRREAEDRRARRRRRHIDFVVRLLGLLALIALGVAVAMRLHGGYVR